MMVNTHVVRINGCGLFIHSRSLLNPGLRNCFVTNVPGTHSIPCESVSIFSHNLENQGLI